MPKGWDIDNPVVCGSREKEEDDFESVFCFGIISSH
jgi:hypothetical protein